MNYLTNDEIGSNAGYNALIGIAFSDSSENELITPTEAEEWCRIDIVENVALIRSIISTALAQCEAYANLSFINRHIKARVKSIGGMWIPYGPCKTELSDVVMDKIETISEDLTLEYDAGFDALPVLYKTAILHQVAWLYEHRGDEVKQSTLSPDAIAILKPNRRI